MRTSPSGFRSPPGVSSSKLKPTMAALGWTSPASRRRHCADLNRASAEQLNTFFRPAHPVLERCLASGSSTRWARRHVSGDAAVKEGAGRPVFDPAAVRQRNCPSSARTWVIILEHLDSPGQHPRQEGPAQPDHPAGPGATPVSRRCSPTSTTRSCRSTSTTSNGPHPQGVADPGLALCRVPHCGAGQGGQGARRRVLLHARAQPAWHQLPRPEPDARLGGDCVQRAARPRKVQQRRGRAVRRVG